LKIDEKKEQKIGTKGQVPYLILKNET